MECAYSLLYSQDPAICPCPEPEESSLRLQGTILITSFHLRPGLQTEVLPSGLAPPKPSMRFSYHSQLLHASALSGREPDSFKCYFLIWTQLLADNISQIKTL